MTYNKNGNIRSLTRRVSTVHTVFFFTHTLSGGRGQPRRICPRCELCLFLLMCVVVFGGFIICCGQHLLYSPTLSELVRTLPSVLGCQQRFQSPIHHQFGILSCCFRNSRLQDVEQYRLWWLWMIGGGASSIKYKLGLPPNGTISHYAALVVQSLTPVFLSVPRLTRGVQQGL